MAGQYLQDLEHRFDYHPPASEAVRALHETVRATCHRAAAQLVTLCPDVPETAEAVKALEVAMFWANAAIARHQGILVGAAEVLEAMRPKPAQAHEGRIPGDALQGDHPDAGWHATETETAVTVEPVHNLQQWHLDFMAGQAEKLREVQGWDTDADVCLEVGNVTLTPADLAALAELHITPQPAQPLRGAASRPPIDPRD